MPWMVLLHIAFLSVWVGGLTLVVGLYRECVDATGGRQGRLLAMTVRLFAWIATLAAVLTVLSGMWLMYRRGFHGGWLPVKLALVSLLVGAHLLIGGMVARLRGGASRPSRWTLLAGLSPLLLAVPIIYLVSAKPF